MKVLKKSLIVAIVVTICYLLMILEDETALIPFGIIIIFNIVSILKFNFKWFEWILGVIISFILKCFIHTDGIYLISNVKGPKPNYVTIYFSAFEELIIGFVILIIAVIISTIVSLVIKHIIKKIKNRKKL